MVGTFQAVSLSTADQRLCVRIAQVTCRKKLSQRTRARIYAVLRGVSAGAKWRA